MGILRERSFGDDLKNFTKTFTSFDKCMAQNICKIPFIVGCVVGGIVVLSILWCFVRCCFCGYAFCACCCGGCGGRRKKSPKYDISPPGPLAVRPYENETTQYAYFDSKSDDALPAMPSVEQTARLAVHDFKETHEMNHVHNRPLPQNNQQTSTFNNMEAISYSDSNLTMLSNEYAGIIPQEKRLSVASSFYSTAPFGHTTSNSRAPAYLPQDLTPPRPQYTKVGGHRNTVQNKYNDVPLNPYQYQGPRQHEQHILNDHHRDQKPEEWSVI